jgi:hypothetical protein
MDKSKSGADSSENRKLLETLMEQLGESLVLSIETK